VIVYELVNDDWARLYLDGLVIAEGHAIYAHDWIALLERLEYSVERREVEEDV
jgi:hypothetical protein